MKNTTLYLFLVLFFSLTTTASFATEIGTLRQYKLDETSIDQLFESSDDISLVANLSIPYGQNVQDDDDKQMIAGIVALASWNTGIGILVPIHRLILGAGNEVGKIIALYCVTLSGCGFILLLDGIMLLMDSHGNKFIENPKFIMWQ